jgi:hypothetical protein
VPELQLHQPVHRNLLAPVLIAFVVLGLVIALVIRYTPHRVADVQVNHVSVYPAHIVFKSDSLVVGADKIEDDVYVLVNLRITDRLNLPIFIKDFTATLVTDTGETFNTSAAEKQDLATIYSTFPAIRPMASAPLERETLIPPEGLAEGMVLLHFPVTQEAWNHRRSATIHIDLYHQGPINVTIPFENGKTPSQSDSESNSDQQ